MLNINKNIIIIGIMYIVAILMEVLHYSSNVYMIIALESFICFGIILTLLINVIQNVYGNSILEIVKKYQKIKKINNDRTKWSIDLSAKLDKIIFDYTVWATSFLIKYYDKMKKSIRSLHIAYITNVFFYKREQVNYFFQKKSKANLNLYK